MSSISTHSTPTLVLSKETPVHFVGVAGIGMSGLAKLLVESGYRVSGSDQRETPVTQALVAKGAAISVGHQGENVPDKALIIVSSAIDEQNPEILKARQAQLPIFHRSTLLKEIFQGASFAHQTTVGVCGTHGKTTITGMTGTALHGAGLEPTIIAGGILPGMGTNAVLGRPQGIAVAELDESDGTLLNYGPTHSIIANIELDHADHYTQGLQGVIDTFKTYTHALPQGSTVLYNVLCPTTQALCETLPSHVEPVMVAMGDVFSGSERHTRYWLKNFRLTQRGCYQGYVYKNTRMLGELNLNVPGRHNLFNALAALAVGDLLEADFDEMADALRDFTGMGRRFEKVGELNGAWLVDDYAHHPTEVTVTLGAAKEAVKQQSGRVFAIFQPHRYSRLKTFWQEFQQAFGDADRLYVTDVYAAGEPGEPGVDSETFCQKGQHPACEYVPRSDWEALKAKLKQEVQPGDIVLSLGAGDITGLLRGMTP